MAYLNSIGAEAYGKLTVQQKHEYHQQQSLTLYEAMRSDKKWLTKIEREIKEGECACNLHVLKEHNLLPIGKCVHDLVLESQLEKKYV